MGHPFSCLWTMCEKQVLRCAQDDNTFRHSGLEADLGFKVVFCGNEAAAGGGDAGQVRDGGYVLAVRKAEVGGVGFAADVCRVDGALGEEIGGVLCLRGA